MASRSDSKRAELRNEYLARSRSALLRRKGEIVVVEGFGVRISVERGRLVIVDGSGRSRRERRFSRAHNSMSRLVVLTGTGTISLAALRWTLDLGVAVLILDRDGRILSHSAPTNNNVGIRRAQALAATDRDGLEIARYLLGLKVRGQEKVLLRLTDRSRLLEALADAVTRVERAVSIDELRAAERDAAIVYWRAWGDVPISFRERDRERVPEHWHRFGARRSPLTSSSRLAISPGNSLANYLYSLVESEARTACLTVGLDPGLGIVHVDREWRSSFALDLMEAVRPDVDTYLIEFLETHSFSASDFHETRRGVCRLLPPLTRRLADTIPIWAARVAPVVEGVARILADGTPTVRQPTPLTQTNWRLSHAERQKPKRTRKRSAAQAFGTCSSCGGPLTSGRRAYCDACLPSVQAAQTAALTRLGSAALAQRRKEGRDPAHSSEAIRRRAAASARRYQERRAWADAGGQPTDATLFVEEILPLLQWTSAGALARATGLSTSYCGRVRRGERVPHRRHWDALRATVQQRETSAPDEQSPSLP
jgi:CRISPR-associated endonuclease Cas1